MARSFCASRKLGLLNMWVDVKIMVPFWIPIIRHLIFRVPQKGIRILTTTHVLSKVYCARALGLEVSFVLWGGGTVQGEG